MSGKRGNSYVVVVGKQPLYWMATLSPDFKQKWSFNFMQAAQFRTVEQAKFHARMLGLSADFRVIPGHLNFVVRE